MVMQPLFILALVAGITAGPLTERQASQGCAKRCTDSTKFGYEPGRTYQFSYNADTVTTLQGAAEEHSSLHIRAIADVEVISKCEHVLTLRDVSLEESDPKDLERRMLAKNNADFKRALESRPLRFSFQDGRIEDLCTAEEDPEWVLNIKRGVLSAFQNSMEHMKEDHKVKEIDVAGKCHAKYSISNRGWSTITVSKSKNLLGCTERNEHNHVLALHAMPYRLPSEVQSMPLLHSKHECVQTLKKNSHLIKSECKETHLYRPFSGKSAGASTSTKQSLAFLRQVAQVVNRNAPLGRRSNMLFAHNDRENRVSEIREKVEKKLNELCAKNDVRPETPRLFTELVYHMRHMDKFALKDLHRSVVAGKLCASAGKYIHDAIPTMGTTASVAMMKDMIKRGHVRGSEAEVWLTSLAFISRPNADMLREIKPLLDVPKPSRTMFLTISTLVHSYCRVNDDCASDIEVQDIVRVFTDNLGNNCKVQNKDHREKVLLSLKALGNTGVARRAAVTLSRCAIEKDNAIDLRLAAIQAFRRLPCTAERNELMTLLKNTEQDAELRVAAYLGVMQCPNKLTLQQVQGVLESEQVNQVGSFIWTHLTNLMETSDPFKLDIRKILSDAKLKKEFDIDKRKFSRNYEKSFLLHSINTGAKFEGNLVWSPRSYIPRSAMMNLTVDLFGSSLNLLELGGRIEGVEHLLESLFAPEGSRDNVVNNILKRNRRSVHQQKMSRINQSYKVKPEDDLQGSLYMKMFGNELRYLDFHGIKTHDLKEKFNILEILIKLARDHKVELSQSAMFLDTSITIPTIIGLPMKLSVNGTATVDLKISGKADLRKAGTSPRSLDIDGFIKPSGAVEVSGLMSVDAHVARTGLKIVTTLHSSVEVNGKLQIKDGQIFNAKFNMPRDKMDIIDFQSKFFMIHREKEREQKMVTKDRVERSGCTSDSLAKVTGLQLCGELKYPNASLKEDAPHFPFTGPLSVKLTLNKKDTHRSYEFEARMEANKVRKNGKVHVNRVARLALNTPGSKVDRELLLDLSFKPEGALDFELKSPWKKMSANGALINEPNNKKLSFHMDMDGQRLYTLLSSLQMQKNKYTPRLEIRIPGRKAVTLTGQIQYQQGKSAGADLALNNVFSEPVSFKGGMSKDLRAYRKKVDLNLEVKCPLFKSKLNTYAEKRKGMLRSRTLVNYAYGSNKHNMVLSGKYRDTSSKANKKHAASITLQMTQFPDYNMQVNMDAMKSGRQIQSNMDMRYGRNFKTTTKHIIMNHVAHFSTAGSHVTGDYNMKLKHKAQNIDVQMKMTHKHNLKELKTQAILSPRPGKNIDIDVHLQKESMKPLRLKGDIKLSIPGRKMRLFDRLHEKQSGVYEHELIAQWQKGQQMHTKAEYRYSPRKHDFKAEMQMPGSIPVTMSGSVSPSVMNPRANIEVMHERKTYNMDLGYNADISGAKKTIKGTIDLKHPARHFVANGEMTGINGEYQSKLNAQWDADNDRNKAINVESRLIPSGHHQEGHIKIKYPGRTLSTFFRQEKHLQKYNSHAEVSWESGKKVALDTEISHLGNRHQRNVDGIVRFTSPFQRFEHLKLHVAHQSTPSQKTSIADFTWAPAKTIVINADMKLHNGFHSMANKLTIKTPFEKFEELVVGTTHKLSNAEAQGRIEASLNDKKVEGEVYGKSMYDGKKRNCQGTLQVKVPIPGFKDVFIRSTNILEPTQATVNLMANVEGKRFEIDVFGKNAGTSYNRDLQGTVKFSGQRDITFSGRHTDDSHRFSTSLEAQWESDKKMAADMSMVYVKHGWHLHNSGRLAITTPFEGFSKMSTNWDHKLQDGFVKTKSDMQWEQKKIAYDVEGTKQGKSMSVKTLVHSPFKIARVASFFGKFTNDNKKIITSVNIAHNGKEDLMAKAEFKKTKIDGQVQMTSRFQGYESFSSKVNLYTDSEPFKGHFEFQWANKKVALDGHFTPKGWRYINGNAQFTSPFQNYESVIFNIDHDLTRENMRSRAEMQYGNGKKIEVETKFDGESKTSISLRTPCQYVKFVEASIDHKGKLNNFNNKANIQFDGADMKITYESSVRFNNFRYINGQAKLTSPFKYFKNTKLQIRHFRRGEAWISRMEYELQPRKEIRLETIYQFEGTKKFAVTMKTPFNLIEDVSASVEHTGSLYKFKNKAEFECQSDNRKTIINSAFNVNGFKAINGNVKVNSPISGLENVIVSLKHSLTGRKLEHISTYNDKKVEVYGRMQNNKASVSIKTPSRIFSSMDASFELSGNLAAFNSKANFEAVTSIGKTVLTGHLHVDGTSSINGHMEFSSPIRNMEYMKVTINHDKKNSDWLSQTLLQHNREKITIKSQISTEEALRSVINIQTTFQGYRNIRLEAMHRRHQAEWLSTAELNYGEKIVIESRFMNNKALSGSLKISTPFEYLKSFSSSFAKTGNWRNLASNAMVDYDMLGGKIEMSTTFQNIHQGQSVEARLNIKTPFQAFKKCHLTATHQLQGFRKYANAITAQIGNEMARVNTLLNLQSPTEFSGQLTAAMPFEQIKSLLLAFNHNGDLRQFNNHFEMQHNGEKKINFDTSFKSTDVIEGSMKLASPFVPAKTMELTFKHHGNFKAFDSRVDFTYENEKLEFSTSFKTSPNFEGKVNLKAPVFQPMTLFISHEGDMKNFRSELDLIIAGQKEVKFVGSLKVDPTIEGGFTLENPLTDDIKLTFAHRGGLKAFQCNAKLLFNKEQRVEGDIIFSAESNLEGKIQLKSSYEVAKDIAVEFSHTGKITDFISFGKIVYAPNKKIEVNAEFKLEPTIHAHVRVQSPWNPVKDVSFMGSHAGTLNNFKSNIDVSYADGQKITYSGTFANRKALEGSFFFSSPFAQDMSITFNHECSRETKEVKSQAHVKYANKEVLALEGNIKMDPAIEGSVVVRSPYKYIKNIKIIAHHYGGLKNFKNKFDLISDQSSLVSMLMNLETTSGIRGGFQLQTPFDNFENIKLSIEHEGSLQNFRSLGQFSYQQNEKIRVETEFKTEPNVQGSFKFTSPFTNMENVAILFSHIGSKTEFHNHIELNYFQGKIQYDGEFHTRPHLRGNFVISTPYTQDLSLFVNHQGNIKRQFSSSTKVSYGESHIKGEINMQTRPQIEGTISFKSPFTYLEDLSLKVKHRGHLKNFRSAAEFYRDGEKKLQGDAELVLGSSAEGFVKVQDMGFAFNHRGDLRAFRSYGEVSYGKSRKISLVAEASIEPTFMGRLHFKSPFKKIEDISLTAKHSGNLDGFKSEVELNFYAGKIFLDSSFTKYPIDFKFNFKSPYTRDTSLILSHTGDLNALAAQGEASYGAKKIHLDGSFQKHPIEAKINFKSPFKNFENIRYSLLHKGDTSKFQLLTKLNYGQQKIHLKGSFKRNPVEVQLDFKSPFTNVETIKYTLSHSGEMKAFTAKSDLTYGDKTFSVDGRFQMQPFLVNFNFKSPLRSIRDTTFALSHTGDMKSFQIQSELNYASQKIELNGKFNRDPTKMEINFKSPFTNFNDIKFILSHFGDLKAFHSRAELTCASGKFQLDGHFDKHPTEVKVNLKSPIDNFKDVSFGFNLRGNMNAFRTQADLQYDAGKLHFEGKFKSQDQIMSTIHVRTPFQNFKNIAATFRHDGDIKDAKTHAEVTYAPGKTVSADVMFKTQPHLDVKVQLRSPFTDNIVMTTNCILNRKQVTYFGKIVYGPGKEIESSFNAHYPNYRQLRGNMAFSSPFEKVKNIHAVFNHRGDLKEMKSQIEMTYNKEQKIAGSIEIDTTRAIRVKATLQTPFQNFEDLKFNFNHAGSLLRFRNDVSFSHARGQQSKVATEFSNFNGEVVAVFRLNTPFRNIRSLNVEIHHHNTPTEVTTIGTAKYAGKEIKVNSNIKKDNGLPLQGSISLIIPVRGYENIVMEFNRGRNDNNMYESRTSFSWAPSKRVQIDCRYKNEGSWRNRNVVASIGLHTPFHAVSQLALDVEHKQSEWSRLFSKWQIEFNGKKMTDFDVQYNHAGKRRAGTLNVRMPGSLKTGFDLKSGGKDISGSMMLENYRFIFAKNDKSNRQSDSQSATLKLVTPIRVMSLEGELKTSENSFEQMTSVTWDEERNKKVTYEFVLADRTDGYSRVKYGRLRLTTPIRSFLTSISHNCENKKHTTEAVFNWDAARASDKIVTIKNIYHHHAGVHKNELTIQNPNMQDIKVRNEMTLQEKNIIFGSRTEVEYSNDKLLVNARLSDVAVNSRQTNYSLVFEVSHPRSTLDVHTAAFIANNKHVASGLVQMKYRNARRTHQNLVLRGDIEKLRNKLSLQLVTPVKSLQVNGKMSSRGANGLTLNMVVTQDNSKNVRAVMDLNAKARTFDMKAYYSPENPKNMLHMYGKYNSKTALTVEAMRQHNGRRVTEASIAMDLKNRRLLHTRLYWRPSMYLDIKEGSKDLYRAMERNTKSTMKQITDVIREEAQLKHRLLVRSLPDIGPLSAFLGAEGEAFQRDFKTVQTEMRRMFNRNEFYMKDMAQKYGAVAEYVSQKMAVINGFIRKQIDVMAEQCKTAANRMAAMVDVALAECRVVCDVVIAFVDQKMTTLRKCASAKMQMILEKYDNLRALTLAQYQELYSIIMAKYQMYSAQLTAKASQLMEGLVSRIEPYLETCSRFYDHVNWKMNRMAAFMQNTASKYSQKMRSHPYYRQFVAAHNKVMGHMNKFHAAAKTRLQLYHRKATEQVRRLLNIDFMKPVHNVRINVRDTVKKMVAVVKTHTNIINKRYNRLYNLMSATVSKHAQDFLDHEDIKIIRSIGNEAYHRANWVYNHYEVQQNAHRLVKTSLDTGVRFVKKNAFYLVDEYLRLQKDRLIKYDPRNGIIEFEVYLPMEWPHLQTVPIMDIQKAAHNIKAAVTSYLPDSDYSIWDTWYYYKPSSDIKDWIPPFKAYAVIGGRQHIMTFDKRYYEFAGQCSYILARDFVDGNFTVVANYEGDRRGVTKKSILVVSNGKHIELFPDFKVTLEGRQMEMPLEFQKTTIRRIGNMVRLDNKKGITVTCDMPHDICTVEIKGWYYGKTAGLFGTYDNEPVNDFTTSDNRKVSDVAEFAKSWEVAHTCRSQENMARTWNPSGESKGKKLCYALFKWNKSPFRSCFKQVNPKPFLSMCINDVEDDADNVGKERSLCKVAAQYVQQCRRERVRLRLPKKCVRCDKPTYGQFTEGETMKIDTQTPVPQSADVVFVVEEKKCNVNAAKKINDIAIAIESALHRQGVTANRFGIVAFGGKCVHNEAHSHTMDGKLFNNARKVPLGTRTMNFENGPNTSLFNAIRFATTYPFRAGVSKTVIAITCSTCEKTSTSYEEIKQLMQTHNIHFHTLEEQYFKLNGDIKTPKSNYLFGIDSETAFLSKHVTDNELVGDKALFQQLVLPQCQCYKLARQTQGSIFNIAKLTTGRVRFQKHFLDLFGRRVAKSAVPSQCQICDCVADELGVGKSVCRPCPVTDNVLPGKPTDNASEPVYRVRSMDRDFEEYMGSALTKQS